MQGSTRYSYGGHRSYPSRERPSFNVLARDSLLVEAGLCRLATHGGKAIFCGFYPAPDARQKMRTCRPRLSLNAGVGNREAWGGSNLGEQIHWIRDHSSTELLHSIFESAPQILVRESLSQPVEFFDSPVPRQGIVAASLIALCSFTKTRCPFGT